MSYLDRLPYDILFGISLFLELEDVVNLSNSSRLLRLIVTEQTLCRRIVENCAGHTLEAKLARKGLITYSQAFLRIYKRRKAFTDGSPASATVVGYGTDFVYNEGVISFLEHDELTVIDLHSPGPTRNYKIHDLIGALSTGPWDRSMLRLLHYSEGTLALLFTDEESGTSFLLAVDLACENAPKPLMDPRPIENPSRIFVRHTRECLFYGLHNATGTRGFREWMIQGISLTGKRFKKFSRMTSTVVQSAESESIQLHEFPGSDIGSTVAFKIHDGYFYALSNCSAFDVVEVDWTSFYHCVRFPIDDPRRQRCQVNSRIYRRQHAEGPINDSWNVLNLQIDERSNQLMIVESRSEWPTGGSSHTRTFYAQEISFPSSEISIVQEHQQRIGPADDPFSTIPDDESKYSPWQDREPWQFHPEAANEYANALERLPSAPSFILARTKFRAYNYTAGTFLDLVEDTCGCRGKGTLCIRLRSGSRQQAPLLPCAPLARRNKGKQKQKEPALSPSSSCPSPVIPALLEDIPRSYRYNPITMWPTEGMSSKDPARIHGIMNPDKSLNRSSVDVKAIADERSIVYMIRHSSTAVGHGDVGKIVCLSFDGDAAISRWKESRSSNSFRSVPLVIRQQESNPEELCGVGEPSPTAERPCCEVPEAEVSAYETFWDDYPDAEDYGLKELHEAFGWPD